MDKSQLPSFWSFQMMKSELHCDAQRLPRNLILKSPRFNEVEFLKNPWTNHRCFFKKFQNFECARIASK